MKLQLYMGQIDREILLLSSYPGISDKLLHSDGLKEELGWAPLMPEPQCVKFGFNLAMGPVDLELMWHPLITHKGTITDNNFKEVHSKRLSYYC